MDAGEFYRRAGDFLCEYEAHHNLILGLAANMVREPGRVENPYLATVEDNGRVIAAALRTPPYNLVLSLAPPEAIPIIAKDAVEMQPDLPGILGPSEESRAFAEEWRRLTGQDYRPGMMQRIYQLEEVAPVAGVPGELRAATRRDRDLLARWLAAFGEEALGEEPDLERGRAVAERFLAGGASGLVLWEVGGEPVSMAGYGGPTPNGVHVSAVYTPPELRKRGYASACVAALSRRLLDEGRKYCFLFTDLSNPTSNHIYTELGYRPVCDVDEYRFQA
jgi:predicted GNAT family acetyltransferase